MFKVRMDKSDRTGRACAAQALRVARASFKTPDEIFGFAITIATNGVQMDREGGEFARAKGYERAAKALDSAAPCVLN